MKPKLAPNQAPAIHGMSVIHPRHIPGNDNTLYPPNSLNPGGSVPDMTVIADEECVSASKIDLHREKRFKTGGRQKGTPNLVTRDIRSALRDLAESNADRVQAWLDQVAEADPAEALRLWLGLLRYVTPTLQAAAITDLRKMTSKKEQLTSMTDAELTAIILSESSAESEISATSACEAPYGDIRDDPLMK